jgi:3-oxoacyl-[acyl-carrier-protein] synthase III
MAPSPVLPVRDLARRRRIVEECFQREAGSGAPLPDDAVDLIETGALDSMAWVSFLRTVESACGVADLGSRLTQRPSSLASVLEALQEARATEPAPQSLSFTRTQSESRVHALLAGSSSVVGSHLMPSEEVDRLFGMPIGKLRSRAGIESIAYASDGENELTLGATALSQALRSAGCGPQELDWIVATSETHHDYPSLASQLHSRLLVRETCGALDVGGACLGLLNALAVAQALLVSGQARTVAIVTADVHSRTLTPDRVAGEFGGLFGDGASAFLLRASANGASTCYRLGEFIFGCAGQYAAAIRVSDDKDGGLAVQFDGEALSRAAITRMEKVLAQIEIRSGIPRSSVGGFATHQPNPRLVKLLAKQLGVSPSTFPPIARTSGNLGSSTCGSALHAALRAAATLNSQERKPIFLASLGPGLVFGGGWLVPRSSEGSFQAS